MTRTKFGFDLKLLNSLSWLFYFFCIVFSNLVFIPKMFGDPEALIFGNLWNMVWGILKIQDNLSTAKQVWVRTGVAQLLFEV